MKQYLALAAALLLAATGSAQTSPSTTTQSTTKTTQTRAVAPRAAELQQMRDLLAAQQQQMAAQQQQMQAQQQRMQQLQQQLQQMQQQLEQAQSQMQSANSSATQTTDSVSALKSDLADAKANSANTAVALQEQQKAVGELEHPTEFHFKGITLTPGGFIEAAGVYRTHNENASVNSASGDFNIPLGGTTNAFLSEFRFDARQSRLSLLGEGKVGSTKVSGYYEFDFLGAAPTANENQSNSFNIRQRQLWGAAAFSNGVTFSGGQQWSLLTLARKGMENRNEFIPLTINAQYVIGYDWARQPAFRIIKNFLNKTWLGFAVENPSTVANVQGVTIPGTATTPPIFGFGNSPNAQSPNGNFTLSNVPGAAGVSTNLAPDLVAKVAFEPGWGHWEIKGVGRFFRDRFNGHTDKVFGGGGGIAFVLPVVKSKMDLIGETLVGNGIGRYGSGGGFDVTLRPDATIVPVRSYHALLGPEVHVGKNLDLYLYGGEEYYARAAYVSATGAGVGYGSPLLNNSGCRVEQTTSTTPSCPNQTRYAFEVTPGFWYRFYKGSSGTVQWGVQYSYSKRALWAAVGGAPTGTQNQVYTSFRYYIP